MLRHQQDVDVVRALLGEHEWHVSVWRYGITHSSMQLALHTGNNWDHFRILCTLCVRFEGNFSGDPTHWSCSIRILPQIGFLSCVRRMVRSGLCAR